MTSPTAQFVLSLGLDGRVASQGSVSEAIAKGIKIKEEIAEEKAAIEKSEQEVDSDAPKTEKKADGKDEEKEIKGVRRRLLVGPSMCSCSLSVG